MTPTPPLLPPAASDADRRALPGWALPIALLGLAILLVSTLPALVARRRLEAAERRIVQEIRGMEQSTDRIVRDRQAVVADRFVLDRALRELLEPGTRVALPRAAPQAP
jgi:hypothetical protein